MKTLETVVTYPYRGVVRSFVKMSKRSSVIDLQELKLSKDSDGRTSIVD